MEKKTTVLIKNVLIVTDGISFYGDILIRDSRIEKIAPTIGNIIGAYQEIDGTGLAALPGLIDDQVHFREPGLAHKATIASESRAALAGGITSFIEQPNTSPPTTDWGHLQDKLVIARRTSYANYGFNLGATNDNFDNLAYMVDKHRHEFAGIKVFMGSSTGNMLVDKRDVLERIFQLDKLAITHCEDELTINTQLAYYKQEFGDAIPMHFHPVIRNKEACFKSSSLAVELATKHGARLHVYHISTEDELALFTNTIPFAEKKITAEVCLHHLWFDSNDYGRLGSLIKWNPAIKDKHHKIALRQAFLTGTLDILATDHAPHTWAEKQNPYTTCPSGAPMVQHLLPGAIELFGEQNLPLIVEKACHNPAILFGIKDRGFIREGYYADLVLINSRSPWKVSKGNILYDCKWSPMEGELFNTKVVATLVNGELAYDNRASNSNSYGIGVFAQPSGKQLEFTK